MNLLKDTSVIAAGTTVLAAGLLLANVGPAVPLFATSVALTALFLTFIAITVNTYRNATPDRTVSRLLHDPDATGGVSRNMRRSGSRSGVQ